MTGADGVELRVVVFGVVLPTWGVFCCVFVVVVVLGLVFVIVVGYCVLRP